jgi:hypothetical protein
MADCIVCISYVTWRGRKALAECIRNDMQRKTSSADYIAVYDVGRDMSLQSFGR